MLNLHEALEILLNAVEPLSTQEISVADGCGRVLAAPVYTPRAFPDTPRSAVDGYALGSTDRNIFQVKECLGAGEISLQHLQLGDAAAVMTGATVPEGAVAVVRVEDTQERQGQVNVLTPIEEGCNINRVGEEAEPEQLILSRGHRLSAVDSSVLCYAGLENIEVYKRPSVGILITGSELLEPGEPHQAGKAYNSNCHLLYQVLVQLGLDCTLKGPIADDPELLQKALDELGAQNDVVVSSGGVSMGKYDYIRPLLQSAPYTGIVNRTGIKPGRPLVVAQRDATLCFGMPGYPAAFLTNMIVYLLPVLKKIAGWAACQPGWRCVRMQSPVHGRKGRCDLVRASISNRDAELYAEPLTDQLTSHYLNLATCDALLLLDSATDTLGPGELAQALIFTQELY
ncbi:MAG: molybdopterin molybdotransferase MoeA [Thermodesulfobacteriota bacterium]